VVGVVGVVTFPTEVDGTDDIKIVAVICADRVCHAGGIAVLPLLGPRGREPGPTLIVDTTVTRGLFSSCLKNACTAK
jgi:hypothetical protein